MNSIEITVNGKPVVVRQATYLDGLVRAGMMSEAVASEPAEEPKTLEEKLLRYTRTFLYPSLMGCSQMKKKISLEKFLDLPDTEVNVWVSAAEKLNPHWFDLSEEDDSKKDPKQTKSTSD